MLPSGGNVTANSGDVPTPLPPHLTREASKLSTWDILKSAVTNHARQLNHVIDCDNAKTVIKEADWKMRCIKEAITIRREKENMNRDEGRYTLSHLYDDIINTGKRD